MRHLPSLVAGALLFSLAMPSTLPAQNEAPVYIEDSPDADDLVKQAEVLREQKRFTEMAAMYQKVADEYPRKLMKLSGSVYVDAARWIRLNLAADAELLPSYRALHEPVAARALDEACKPAPKLAVLEGVASRFALCESGLEAALRAAALHLERGRPIDAANVLDDFAAHPDIAKHRPRWQLLQAFAAAYMRDGEKLATLTAYFKEAKNPDAIKQIETLSSQLKTDNAQPIRSALHVLPKVTVPDPPGKPLYTRDAEAEPAGRNDPARRGTPDHDHPMIPTVAGDTVYLNTGQTLRAVDRSSLSDIWTTPYTAGPGIPDGTAYDRFGVLVRDQVARDQRGVMVDGEFVAAVMGRSAPGRNQAYTAMPETSLVVLNRADGKPLWRRTPAEFDPSLTPASFHGTPVGGDGRAYVMVRRTQNSGFRDAFLIAVDLRSGTMVWKRHLSSTTLGFRVYGFTQLLADRGRLYVADNLGAIACLDGRTGGVIWFHKMTKFQPNIARASNSTSTAWSVAPPLLVKAGLIVPPFMGGVAATLLDAKTGEKIRDLDSDPFSIAAYLMEVNGDILSIGAKVHRINGETLAIKWTHAQNIAPAARAAVTEDRVIIPTADKLITLDLADGKQLSDAAMTYAGNVLALDGQLLITSGSDVRSYMTWPVVYANLTVRIRKEPTDPKPGLALAHAAIASGRSEEAIEGIDHVVAVLRHRSITRPADVKPESDEVHAEAFQQLLRLGDATVTSDLKLRGEVFDRIAKATVTPRDEAQYHLAYASHLVDSQWPAEAQLDRRREAALHFQNVLESPLLAAQLVPRAGGRQQAGVEARMKLAGMIERFGRSVYEEFDERAAEQLTRLLAAGDPDPAQLVELTRKYPLAKAAGAALLAAGEALGRSGKPIDAITHLRRAYREKSAVPLRPRIISALVEQYARIGKPARARQWLQRADRDNLPLVREGKPIAARSWLSELGSQPLGAEAMPELRTALGKPVVLPGALLLPKMQPREHWPMDRVMLAAGETVQMRGGPAFDKLWEAKLEPGAELMWLNDTAVLFWTEATGRLVALDVRNGKRLWTELTAQTIFKEMMAPAPRAKGEPGRRRPDVVLVPDGAGRLIIRGGVIVDVDGPARAEIFRDAFDARVGPTRLSLHGQPVVNETFGQRPYRLIINDAVVCLADANGRVVGIDLDSGQVKWQFVCPFDRLDQLAINGECVAFAGGTQGDDGAGSLVIALDALTGDMITQFEAADTLAWLGLTEGDTLVYIDQPADRRVKAKVVTHQLPDGDQQWKADLTTGRIDAVTLAGDNVILLVDGTDLLVVDPVSRTARDPLGSVMIDRTDGVDIAPAGGHWHMLTPQLGTALKADAKAAWRDGIDEEAGDRVLQLVGRDRMLVATFKGDEEMLIPRFPPPRRLPDPRLEEDFTVTYRLFVLNRKGGSIEHEYRLPLTAARLQASQAVLLNHRVLLGAGQLTIMIPDAE